MTARAGETTSTTIHRRLPPVPEQQETSRSASPAAAFPLPPSVVASLSSAPSGSRASLPSQAASPRMSVDLTRGIVVSGSGARRAEGRDSPNRQSWAEPRSASPEPVPAPAQEPQDPPTASSAPKTPIPEEEESSAVPDKRFSRSPQLPDTGAHVHVWRGLFHEFAAERGPAAAHAVFAASVFWIWMERC